MAYKSILLSRKTPSPGSPATLRGGQLARASRVGGALRNQDLVPQHGARLIGRLTSNGAQALQIPAADDPAGTLTQTYPTATDTRELARFRWTLAPGYQPAVSLISLPSGPTQVSAFGVWNEDVQVGQVVIDVTWTAAGTATRTIEITPPASPLQNKQVPAAPWSAISERVELILPPDFNTPAEVAAYSSATSPVTVEVVVSAVGSPRVIDLAVYEVGVAFAQDAADGPWPFHCFTNGNGQPLGSPAPVWPVESVTATDPTQGHRQAADVADEQPRALGPVLWTWTAITVAEDVAATTPTPWQTSAIAPAYDWYDGWLLGDETYPGVSSSAGALSRQHDLSGDVLELRDEDGVIPVRVHVYGNTDVGGGLARVRVQVGDSSWVDVDVDSPTLGWFTATGELRCGVGVESTTTLRWGGAVVTCAQLDVLTVVVEHVRR